MWVYMKFDTTYHVGFYPSLGGFISPPEERYKTLEEASKRVNFLNGGPDYPI